MKFILLILIAFFLHPQAPTEESGKDEWKLEKDKNNIKIWTRKIGDSGIKSFKAIVIYDASVSQLASVLNDVEAYPEWMSDVEATKILKEISENERYYYLLVNAPWPLSNRDNVVHFKLDNEL